MDYMIKALALLALLAACVEQGESVRFSGRDFEAVQGSDLKPAPRMIQSDWLFTSNSSALSLDLSPYGGCTLGYARVLSSSSTWLQPITIEIWQYNVEPPIASPRVASFSVAGPRSGGEIRTAHRVGAKVPIGEVYLFVKGEDVQFRWLELDVDCP